MRRFIIYSLYQIIVRVIRSVRMGLAGHVAHTINNDFWLENLKEIDHLEDLCADGRIVLK
jgi:hypothetical protein